MSFQLTRTSATPASPLAIVVTRQEPGDSDAGLANAGTYNWEPGEQLTVSDYVAGVIMGDPGLAKHFECLPPWPTAEKVGEPVVKRPASGSRTKE